MIYRVFVLNFYELATFSFKLPYKRVNNNKMENKLTAEEAIENLNLISLEFDEPKYKEALTMAIEALQSKPKQGGLTAEEILGKHVKSLSEKAMELWGFEDRQEIRKMVLAAMHEYTIQSQPPTVTDNADYISKIIKSEAAEMYWRYPTVTDEEIDKMALKKYADFDPHIIHYINGLSDMRNKLTPNK